MSYYQAQQRALKLARGSEGDSDKPVTVAEALDAYESDFAARGGAKYNATSGSQPLFPGDAVEGGDAADRDRVARLA